MKLFVVSDVHSFFTPFKQALDEVEARFTEEASRIDSALNLISVKTIVEEPDEDPAEEVVCEEPFQESTEDSAQE